VIECLGAMFDLARYRPVTTVSGLQSPSLYVETPFDRQEQWGVFVRTADRQTEADNSAMNPALPDSLCYLNGTYSPLSEAKVSVLDRGFIFGDGVYEVLPAYEGRIFRFAQHMARLERSLRELRIPAPHSREEWLAIARRLIADQQGRGAMHQLIYLQVTRGVALRDHAMPPDLTPTVFAMGSEMKLPTPAQREQPLPA